MTRPTPYEIAQLAAMMSTQSTTDELVIRWAIDLWDEAAKQIEARYGCRHVWIANLDRDGDRCGPDTCTHCGAENV